MKKTMLLLAFFPLIFVSCDPPLPKSPQTISNIVRIMMHERDHYTVVVQDPSTKVMTPYDLGERCDLAVQYIPDIPASHPMSLIIRHNGRNPKSYEFHVRSEQDINGAGWDHGKFGSGQTNIVK